MRENYLRSVPVYGFKDYLEGKVFKLANTGLNYGTNFLKRTFGKEYMFQYSDDGPVINAIIMKWIRKYDKHFNNHITKETNDEPTMANKQFIIKFDNRTFMYVATGDKIGKTENRFLMASQISSRDMYIYIFGRNARYIIHEFEKLTHDVYCSKELGLFTVDCGTSYRGMITGDNKERGESLDVTYSKLALRSLDTLFFSFNEKEKICNHINRFNENKSFYMDKQLLYKTGILLYGQPGTGKSSLVKAIASTYNRSIISVNVSNVQFIDLAKLTQSINVDESRQYIILLEDIDTLFLNRDSTETDKAERIVVNKLLQFLDSNTSPTNVIFIATTNHLDRLDEALLREGRFDLKVNCQPVKDKEAIEFGKSFTLTEEQAKDLVSSIHKELAEKNQASEFINQSLLQARILAKVQKKDIDKVEQMYGVMEE